MNRIKGIIFDLDGVIVDTAKYHYQAWKNLALTLGYNLTEEENENLKGVSRMASLDYICKLAKVELEPDEKTKYAYSKNQEYLKLLENLNEEDILPGIYPLLHEIKKANIKLALGSASKNSRFILEKLCIIDLFDTISDGNSTNKSKPDPEVFLIAAKAIGLQPDECLVIEDSIKGLEAANLGGFHSVGVGQKDVLVHADKVYTSLGHVNLKTLLSNY